MRTTIKLALTPRSFLQPSQIADSDISTAYDQQKEIRQPKVLNQVNCVPLAHGVKSASMYSASMAVTVLDENGAATPLELGPSTELTTVIDANGNLWYVLLDRKSGVTFTTDIYTRAAANSQVFQKYATITTSTRYEYNIQTVFQNKTLFAALPNVVYHQASSTIVHPDAVDAAPGQFFDLDLTAKTIRRFDLIGIGASVLDAVQCVTSYQTYMLLFTRNRLYYSCPTDPFDFTPTDAGAGSTAVAEVRGDILAVLPSASGFIIYCRDNIVVGRFTGSTVQPFTFSEIKGSSGLIMRGEEALLVKNETNQVHYAVLVSGLSIISENEVQPITPLLSKFASNNFTETRVPNTGRLVQVNHDDLFNRDSKIRRMYSFGSKLFLLIATDVSLEDMVYVYDISDNSIGVIHGNYVAISPTLTQTDATTDLVLQKKVSAITDSFVLLRNASGGQIAFDTLDFGSKSDNALGIPGQESEILIGDISFSPDRSTYVESVQLYGRLQRYVEDDADYNPNATDRVRVFGYSEWYDKQSLLEFQYNPADNRYYGGLEGPNVRLLIVGSHFYLTGAELRIDTGILN